MDTTITISTRTGIVQYFSTIFTTPTAELFTRLVTGWVLCTAKRTITRILPFADPQGQRTHDAYHRFFPDPSWATSQLWKLLTILLVKIFHPSGVIPTDLDDTLFHHSGHKVNGAGWWRDAVRSRGTNIVHAWGLNLVVLTLRIYPPWGGEPLGLPINYKTAQEKRPNIDRFGRRDVGRSCPMAARKAVSLPLRRFLRFFGWTGHTQYTYNLSHASGCKYLRFAGQEEKETKGSSPQKRQEVACSRADGQASAKLETGRDSRTRQNQKAIGLLQKGYLVQGIREAGIVGYQSSSERQRERRFFLHHRFESQSFRSHWWFCRPLEYRGYIQEHKAVSRWPAAPDLEAQRSRTSCCCELLALFGGVALVSPAEESPQNFSCSSLVSWQNLPELSGCFGLSSTRALATEN